MNENEGINETGQNHVIVISEEALLEVYPNEIHIPSGFSGGTNDSFLTIDDQSMEVFQVEAEYPKKSMKVCI